MPDKEEPAITFLAEMGIKASIVLVDHEKLIAISTEQYHTRRRWIETWFTLVDQKGESCYFRERLRGTGKTIESPE